MNSLNQFTRGNISTARNSRDSARTDKNVRANVEYSNSTPYQRASSVMLHNIRGSTFDKMNKKDSKAELPTSSFESLTTLRVDTFE